MKTISLRSLSRDAPTITEDVLVTHDSRIIGKYTPTVTEIRTDPYPSNAWKDASMDDQARKAIEPDQTKTSKGKISKGLGELPGEPKPTVQRDPYKEFKPVPKK